MGSPPSPPHALAKPDVNVRARSPAALCLTNMTERSRHDKQLADRPPGRRKRSENHLHGHGHNLPTHHRLSPPSPRPSHPSMWGHLGPRYLSLQAPISDVLDQALLARRDGHIESNNILTGLDPTAFSSSDPVRLFIIQAVIIVCFTRLLGWFGTYLHQPRVIAEVIGGILLGPTVFGRIPGFTKHIFPPPSLPYLNLISTLGLILFLFLVGLEVDFRAIQKCYKEALAVGITGIVVPFGLGAAISVGIYKDMIDHSKVSFGHFILFTGVAIAITAFPVLARILTEQKLTGTKVGTIVLAAGVGNDIVGWILLALTIALVNASSGVIAVYILLIAVGWVLFLIFAVRPVLVYVLRRTGALERGPSPMVLTATLLLVLISAWLTDIIGVHPIFGAFFVGLIVPHEGGFAIALVEKIEDLVSALFLPIYFTLSGINTNLASLDTGTVWAYLVGVTAVAFMSKFLSCAAAAKACGCQNRESLAVGTLMSCKGLVELIVLNVGLNAGILDTRTFSMFVVMALVSTVATTPLTLWAYPPSVRTTLDEQGNFHISNESKDLSSTRAGDAQGGDQSTPPQDDPLALLLSRPRRLRIVLDQFEHLPVLMTLVQFLGPVQRPDGLHRTPSNGTEASGMSVAKSAEAKARETDVTDGVNMTLEYTSEVSGRPAVPPSEGLLSLDALRLLELTDRTSAVMRASETEDTLASDNVWAVFQTACQLHALPTSARVSVVSPTPSDLAEAILAGSPPDTLWVPWFVSLNETWSTSGVAVGVQAHLIRRLQRHAPCAVATLLQRPLTASSRARTLDTHHICVAFFGGSDARVALEYGLVLVAQNAAVHLTVLRFFPEAEALDDAEGDAHEMRSASDLVDNLTFDRLHSFLASSPHAVRERVSVRVIPTNEQLQTLLRFTTSSQPGLVLVGRKSTQDLRTEQGRFAEQGRSYEPEEERPKQDDPDMLKTVGPAGWTLHFHLASEPFALAGRQLPPTIVFTSPAVYSRMPSSSSVPLQTDGEAISLPPKADAEPKE